MFKDVKQASNVFLKVLITIRVFHLVSSQTGQLEKDCHILRTLDELQDRLATAEALIDDQNTKISTLQTSLVNADTRIVQQNTEITALQTSLTTAETEIENLKTFLEESSARTDVVFHVRDVDGQPAVNDAIKFAIVIANTDNVYDIETGCFIAPRSGTFWFSALICVHIAKTISPSMYIRGVLISRMRIGAYSLGNCGSFATVSVLEEGDAVCLKNGPVQSSTPLIWTDSLQQFSHFMGSIIN